MADSSNQLDQLFMQLVMSFQAGAWQAMGKVASPFTGKVERDLNMAKHTIDMLGMIQEKTQGNLTPEEKQLLDRALYELRLNYVDEQKKGDTQPEEEQQPAENGSGNTEGEATDSPSESSGEKDEKTD